MQKADILAEVEHLGDNDYIVIIEGETFEISAPSETIAKDIAIKQFING